MPYVKHTVVSGDTLQGLAQRYLGDASRWMDIAILNELDYPFIWDGVRDSNTPVNVRAIGETITIPVEESISDIPVSELQQGYDRVLGEDIDVFSGLYNNYGNSILPLTGVEQAEMSSDSYGDLCTVKGIKNLHQAILMRLMTPQGSLLHHPDYGSQIHMLLGSKGIPNQIQKAKIELERTIRSDKRVEDVTIQDFAFDGQTLFATIQIKPIGIDQIVELGIKLDQSGVVTWA